jgi:tetratricopeptide (TPR) repeat protein
MTFRIFTVALLALLAWGAAPANAYDRQGCFAAPSARVSIKRLIAQLNRTVLDLEQPENRACSYYGRGLLFHLEGDTEHAIEDYTSAIGWMANYADAYAARGDAYEDLGQHDKAMQDYAQAARLSSNLPNQFTERCWIRALRGRPLARALEDCNASLQMRPDNSDTYTSRGLVYLRMANYPAALADLDAAVKLDHSNPAALYFRALAKLHTGDSAGGNSDLAAAKGLNSRVDETFAIYGVKM